MSLTGLPTELLCSIISYLLPDDYESLMLSCQRLYEAGRDFLLRHNDLRKRFRHFKYNDELQSSLQLLYLIAEEPNIANYIKTANFLGDTYPDGFHRQDLEAWNAFLTCDSAVDHIRDILIKSKSPGLANLNSQKWSETVVTGTGGPAIFATIIILSLLLNVQELVLPRQWLAFPPTIGKTAEDERSMLWIAIEGLVQRSNIEDRHNRPLSQLARIHPFHFDRRSAPLALQVLSPFFALRSLKELRASNCHANRAQLVGRPFHWRYPSQISNIERIELAASCVDGELVNLLKHTPLLRSFKLSYESKWWGCGADWDAYRLIEALRSHCAETLSELSLTIDSVAGTVKGGLCSLTEFVKLETLELDSRVFFGPPPVTRVLQEMTPIEYRNHAYEMLGWNGTAVPSFAEILPSTIKSVRLITGSSREDILIVKSLFARLGDRAAESLPHVETIDVVRATSVIGDQLVSTGQSAVGWRSVGAIVRAEGYQFADFEGVKAAWLKDFYEQTL